MDTVEADRIEALIAAMTLTEKIGQLRDPVPSVSRPLLELRSIAKAVLDPGASATLPFRLTADDLRFLGPDLVPRLEPGLIEVFVGPSADPSHLLGPNSVWPGLRPADRSDLCRLHPSKSILLGWCGSLR